jgi:hypothetical protein
MKWLIIFLHCKKKLFRKIKRGNINFVFY